MRSSSNSSRRCSERRTASVERGAQTCVSAGEKRAMKLLSLRGGVAPSVRARLAAMALRRRSVERRRTSEEELDTSDGSEPTDLRRTLWLRSLSSLREICRLNSSSASTFTFSTTQPAAKASTSSPMSRCWPWMLLFVRRCIWDSSQRRILLRPPTTRRSQHVLAVSMCHVRRHMALSRCSFARTACSAILRDRELRRASLCHFSR
mmetsp:Transcript_32453/g.103081  ORF Transcript_32453/g.103081 Transcript_32453/m.103081 type:complete len:206 (-) Transcript_32453:2377-2994(-)